ncbi:tRNA (adenine(58)-N(1))-methyltransferase, mitochondrial [Holothuria leucospilota]|uniref:tRNA (adenine(58)-N(1))-methyltransferase n=1 Tax=Holothuria leucospilota TaxID=206669 RepID=A0A9Q1CI99_HOLLE|nr:tRNA (adenine(58)-N(1))-methyltransferase, mitochondrial [Holothuria leucospilota]
MALLVKNLKKAPACLLYRQGKELTCFHLCCKYGYFWKVPSRSNFCDKKCENSVGDKTQPNPIEKHRVALFGRKRRLSPMDRINYMIETTTPQADQKDVTEIANNTEEDECKNLGVNNFRSVKTSNDSKSFSRQDIYSQSHQSERLVTQNVVLIDKEFVFVVMENVKAHVSLKEMFLLEAGKTFQCKHGKLHHTDIIGHPAGKVFVTDKDTPVLVRRPSLEEYVIHMKRKATISYPKDCSAMLMMVDVSPGDTILEAGTGSGAMTLFLSRAGTLY